MNRLFRKLGAVFFVLGSLGMSTGTWSQQTVREYALEFGATGRVSNVFVQEGEKVSQGQLLAELDDTWFVAQVEAARAALAATEAEQFEVQRALDRDQVLYDEGSLSGVELELSRIRMLKAHEKYLSTKADLAKADGILGISKILAPAEGTILKIATGSGENIVAGSHRPPSIVMQSGQLLPAN